MGGKESLPIAWNAGENINVSVAVYKYQKWVSVLFKDKLHTGI